MEYIYIMSKQLLKRYISMVVEATEKDILVDDENSDDETQNEFCTVAGGAIAGVQLPLGMPSTPMFSKKRKKNKKK
jgi:hypothetical protein